MKRQSERDGNKERARERWGLRYADRQGQNNKNRERLIESESEN